MFKNIAVNLAFTPEDGMEVLVYGRISSYLKYGDYQIIVNHMEQYGKGKLYEAYEQLKQKLAKEGLFDESLKKNIPDFVNKIGIVTSKDGAALSDILKVIDSLNVNIEILIYSVRVQGKEAEKEIPRAIEYLNAHHKDLEVLLVGRGGGSVEDLWAFNTEPVARAIFNSKIPVISCVGHEIDFTIADFVADMRAPTPSAAAEMILRNRKNIESKIKQLEESLKNAISSVFENCKEKLKIIGLARALTKPYLIYEDKTAYVDELENKLSNNINRLLDSKFEKVKNLSHKLDIVSPLSILKRGFSVCFDDNNQVIKDAKDVNVGDTVNVKLSQGRFSALVKTSS
jgi:exodeoxyribonuclease VII large subunit